MVARRISTPSSSELISDVALAMSVFNAIGGPIFSWKALTAASVNRLGSAMVSLSESRFLGGVEQSKEFPALPPLPGQQVEDVLAGGNSAGDIVISSGATVLRLPLGAAAQPQTVKHVERLLKMLVKAEVQRVEITTASGIEKFTLQRRSDEDA